MNRSLKLFIILSVLLNLLLIGMVCGHVGRAFLPFPARPTAQEITASLPAAKRGAFQAILTRAQTDIAPLRTKIEEGRRTALCILATDPFDQAAYRAQVDALHGLHKELTQHMIAALSSAALTPEERIAFMDLLRPPPPPQTVDRHCTSAPQSTH